MDVETALALAEVLGPEYGIGFSTCPEQWAVDIDDALQTDGTWSPLAQRLCALLPGAAREVSRSGTGLHLFGRGSLPAHGAKNVALGIELYDNGQHIALTGTGCSGDAADDCSAAMASLVPEYFPRTAVAVLDPAIWSVPAPPETEDAPLIARMLKSKPGSLSAFSGKATLPDLWIGNTPVLAASWPAEGRDFDHSSADASLASHMAFWTGKNAQWMWRLMHASALKRDKWKIDVHKDYLQRTIENAISQCTEVYTPRTNVKPISQLPDAIELANVLQTQGLIRNTKNEWPATIDCVTAALSYEGFHRKYGYDSFKQQVMFCDWEGPDRDEWMPMTDVAYTDARLALCAAQFDPKIGKDVVRDSIQKVADRFKFDSAQIWLNGLKWDGVPRIERFFTNYAQSDDRAYVHAVGRYFWSAAAGRIIVPGCQADMVTVMISETQGLRKTRGIEAMNPFPEAYVTINLADRDADLSRRLRGRLIVELDELRGLRAKDQASIKSWITQRSDTWRQTYHEFMLDAPRRFVMIGSTNEMEFLDDPTGNRRWLPIVIRLLNAEAIARDRDQLWAEGAELFRSRGNNVDWRDAEMLAVGEHSQHRIHDDLEPLVISAVEKVVAPFQLGEVMFHMGMSQTSSGIVMEKRVGNILRALGYKKKVCRVQGTENKQIKAWG